MFEDPILSGVYGNVTCGNLTFAWNRVLPGPMSEMVIVVSAISLQLVFMLITRS